MSLRLRHNINPEVLRSYGFKTGKEWGALGVQGVSGDGYKYQEDWFHKFKMRSEDCVDVTEEGDPCVSMYFRTDGTFSAECIPEYTYHVTGSDLNVITDTIFDLAIAGLIEKA